MKKLLVVILVVAAGAFVYWKWASPSARAQQKLASLCDTSMTDSDMEELKTLTGDSYDKAMRCVNSSNSCIQASACILSAGADELQKGVEKYEHEK